MMTEEEKLKYDRLVEHRKNAYQGWWYSIQRMDLLIISISGVGIWVILELLKYSKASPDTISTHCNCIIKVSAFLFILSIIVNIISQYTGKEANHHEMCYCDFTFKNNLEEAEKHTKETIKFTKLTNTFNDTSMVSMLLGLAILTGYFLFNF